VPVEETSIATFGVPLMPVNALMDWAIQHDGLC
jgi:hypothetical protein